uniref:Stomatin like 1 n=1 Tax=Myotis myotis TaxID=51298 RepID=A0A7J8ARN2_MYOMY|nr:stomatin like 1 [Myotis myotis]
MTVKDLNTAIAQSAMTKALLKRPLQAIQMEKLKISNQLLVGSTSQGRIQWLAPGPPFAHGTLSKAADPFRHQSTLCMKSVTTFEEPVVWVGL